jgi:membrane-associated phospholipid phosphatase
LVTNRLRQWTLRVLSVYVALTAIVNVLHLLSGRGSFAVLGFQVVLLWLAARSFIPRTAFWDTVGDWLPLIALPLLYWSLPWTMIGPPGRLFDATVQGWDQSLFGTQPARTMASALPSRPLSELLHLAYLLYYAILYLPPFIFYRQAARRGYFETVFAMTLTVVVSFAAFSLFPVEGPRFAWGAPQGVPSGPIRSLTVFLLEHGSARGTAFPSSHVAIALAQSLSSLRWRPRLGVVVLVTTILLAIGAVYGGFHYATDILAGAVLGFGSWALARRIAPARHQ